MKYPLSSRHKLPGLTLVELTISMAIFTLALFSAVSLYVLLSRGEQRNQDIRDVQQTSRFIIEAITRDIRIASSVIPTGNAVTVNNEQVTGTVIRYALDDTDLTREICQPICTGIGQPINPDNIIVDSFTVEPQQSLGLTYYKISLSAKLKDISDDDPDQYQYQLETTVTGRK